jgi:hypothetical protein
MRIVQASELDHVGKKPGVTTYQLCDLGQASHPFWGTVLSPLNVDMLIELGHKESVESLL